MHPSVSPPSIMAASGDTNDPFNEEYLRTLEDVRAERARTKKKKKKPKPGTKPPGIVGTIEAAAAAGQAADRGVAPTEHVIVPRREPKKAKTKAKKKKEEVVPVEAQPLAEGETKEEEEAPPEGEEADPDEELEETQQMELESFMHEQEEERERLRLLVSQFTPEQLRRYECYRGAAFNRANVKRVMQSVAAGTPINQTMCIIMGGVAKVFVGEVVEAARTVMEERGEVGPIRPIHVREAYRRLQRAGKTPASTRQHVHLFSRR